MPRAAANPPKEVKRRPRISPNGYQLPDPIRPGEILTDVLKRQWKLGKSIGIGGFGEIYSASDNISRPVGLDAGYVVKIEPHANGPLFSEMHFYHRVAKEEMIESWMKSKKLKFLGMPKFIGSGSHDYNGNKYRFMVMERFGDDLQKVFEENGKSLHIKTVYTLGIKILDILEYIHSNGYIHADIKGSNLLLGFGKGSENQVYLVDFGLACRYVHSDGQHKEYKEDPRKAHDGTIEYTSRDAHIGAHSRRGDLEILGYNMVQWISGQLPWENLKNPDEVKDEKIKYMETPSQLIKKSCKNSSCCPDLQKYLEYVSKLGFEETPNYEKCRKTFREGILRAGSTDDGKFIMGNLSKKSKVKKKQSKRKSDSEDENLNSVKPQKIQRSSPREPCAPAQTNRIRKAVGRPRKAEIDKKDDSNKVDTLQNSNSIANNGLSNPTPAMLEIMNKIKQKKNIPIASSRKKKAAASTGKPSSEFSQPSRKMRSYSSTDSSPELF